MSIGDLGSAILGGAYAYRVPLAVAGVVAFVVLLLLARRYGWLGIARRHRVLSGALAAVVLLVGVPVAWYLVSPVFLRTELDEPAPVVAAREPGTDVPADPSASALPGDTPASAEPSRGPDAPSAPVAATPAVTTATPAPARSGSFTGTDDFHFGRGTVTLLETAPGEWTLRFEDFSVRNGPDLYVYLSPDRKGWDPDAVEVARLKATDGSFNQRVPDGTDLSKVRSVLIWCKQFSHLFAVAPLGG